MLILINTDVVLREITLVYIPVPLFVLLDLGRHSVKKPFVR
jgi:hypothetical protein